MNRPLSVHLRLVLIAGVSGLFALLVAGVATSHVLQGVVRQSLDAKLDAQIKVLERAISADGHVDPSKLISLQGFDGHSPGWGWRVESPDGDWFGGDQIQGIEMLRGHKPASAGQVVPKRGSTIGRPGSAHTASGLLLFLRQHDVVVAGTTIRITAAGPRQIAEKPLREAMLPLLSSLLLLGIALSLATWAQLRFGLQPLRDLRDAVARIRSGEAVHICDAQPREFRPLVEEVNALIAQNQAGLAHARSHVANLAHGLKTPLATLALKLQRESASEESRALVAQLDKRIAHHLRRARTASVGGGERARTPLNDVVRDLFLAMSHVHADRSLTLDQKSDGALLIAVDREDLEEMLGNLLDNACRHARSRVSVGAEIKGQLVQIRVEDDGPGIAEDELKAALNPGIRLDETGRGYGFGLSIVRELAELYGGSLRLGKSEPLGGLMATLQLPRQK